MKTFRTLGTVVLVVAALELAQAAVAQFFGFTAVQASFVVGAVALALIFGIVAAKAGEEDA